MYTISSALRDSFALALVNVAPEGLDSIWATPTMWWKCTKHEKWKRAFNNTSCATSATRIQSLPFRLATSSVLPQPCWKRKIGGGGCPWTGTIESKKSEISWPLVVVWQLYSPLGQEASRRDLCLQEQIFSAHLKQIDHALSSLLYCSAIFHREESLADPVQLVLK